MSTALRAISDSSSIVGKCMSVLNAGANVRAGACSSPRAKARACRLVPILPPTNGCTLPGLLSDRASSFSCSSAFCLCRQRSWPSIRHRSFCCTSGDVKSYIPIFFPHGAIALSVRAMTGGNILPCTNWQRLSQPGVRSIKPAAARTAASEMRCRIAFVLTITPPEKHLFNSVGVLNWNAQASDPGDLLPARNARSLHCASLRSG